MDGTNRGAQRSDALVLFGVTGELAHKKIFPALYAMAKRGTLDVPVVGVAFSKWNLAQPRKRATDSIKASGRIDDRPALRHLLSLLRYVSGNYKDPDTRKTLKQALGTRRRPAHYLAIPPKLFATIIEGLGAPGLAGGGSGVERASPGQTLQARQLGPQRSGRTDCGRRRLVQPGIGSDISVAAADKPVFLLDCDNTLLDNDRVIEDLPDYDFSALTSPAGSVDGR